MLGLTSHHGRRLVAGSLAAAVGDRAVLVLACLGQFMVILDVSVVNVALPSIRADLHFSATGLQWVVNAYVLTFAGFLLLGGRAADLFGRRRAFIVGLLLFAAASLAGGLAANAAMLTIARAVQGVGGAILSPATLTLIVTTFPHGERRNRALGLWSAVASVGGAAGNILGGVLTNYLSWRWILYLNVPIGIIGAGAALLCLTAHHRPVRERALDTSGALVVTAGMVVLIYAIVDTDTHPWTSARILGLLGLAVAILAIFVLIEARLAKSPIMPFRMFRIASVRGSNLVMLLIGSVFFSFWYFLSLYMQGVLGYSAIKAGMGFLPLSVAAAIGATVGSRAISRTGIRPMLVVGSIGCAVGYVWLSRLSPHSAYAVGILGPGLLVAFFVGLTFPPLALGATAEVHHSDSDIASGLLNTSRQLGGSIGLAVLATIATDRTDDLTKGASLVHGAAVAALSAGYARAFLVSAAIVLVAACATLAVPRIGRRNYDLSDEVPVLTSPARSNPPSSSEAESATCNPPSRGGTRYEE